MIATVSVRTLHSRQHQPETLQTDSLADAGGRGVCPVDLAALSLTSTLSILQFSWVRFLLSAQLLLLLNCFCLLNCA